MNHKERLNQKRQKTSQKTENKKRMVKNNRKNNFKLHQWKELESLDIQGELTKTKTVFTRVYVENVYLSEQTTNVKYMKIK